jgi:hypothetical protein
MRTIYRNLLSVIKNVMYHYNLVHISLGNNFLQQNQLLVTHLTLIFLRNVAIRMRPSGVEEKEAF